MSVYSHSGIPNLKFTINTGGTTATITESYLLTGAVTIPQLVTQGSTSYTVTAIGNDAFRTGAGNGAEITSVTMPNTVTTIGSHAFYRCYYLASVTLSNTLTSIGYNSFHFCSALLNVSIPASVTFIDGYAFHFCSNLRQVIFANTSNMSSLPEGSFTQCSKLSGVMLPRSITTITGAFDTLTGAKTIISYYGLHYAITDFGTNSYGVTYGHTLSISAEIQTQTKTFTTTTINPTSDKLTFTITKNYDSLYQEQIWPDHPERVYGTQYSGLWTLNSNNNQGNGIAGTRITGTLTLTYTPTKTTSIGVSDFCQILLKRPAANGGGFEGSGTATIFKVYAKVFYNVPTTLDSRLTALNGRAMFNINVQEQGDTSTRVQLFTSTLGGATANNSPHGYIQDCRYDQTYLFGPSNDTPCDIQVLASSFSDAGLSYGTSRSLMRATVFLAYSDYRLKHNVETLNKTHTVDDIRVVKYTTDDNTPHFGVIAHELAEVYPELVRGEKDEKMLQSVSYIELIPILINEVQTIKKQLITLKKENEQLREQLEQKKSFN